MWEPLWRYGHWFVRSRLLIFFRSSHLSSLCKTKFLKCSISMLSNRILTPMGWWSEAALVDPFHWSYSRKSYPISSWYWPVSQASLGKPHHVHTCILCRCHRCPSQCDLLRSRWCLLISSHSKFDQTDLEFLYLSSLFGGRCWICQTFSMRVI